MTNYQIYLFNDKNKPVNLRLSINQIRLLEVVFDLKTDVEKEQFLKQMMERDFSNIYQESFDALKDDFENHLDEMLDVTAGANCWIQFNNGNNDCAHFEQVNSLMNTGCFVAHRTASSS